MKWRKWEELPQNMQTTAVKEYYTILSHKRGSLIAKRIFDIVAATIATVILSPLMGVIAILIKLDSKGPVLFRQVRVTQYGREFRICKFRTMQIVWEARLRRKMICVSPKWARNCVAADWMNSHNYLISSVGI